jgi:hypothetical protein
MNVSEPSITIPFGMGNHMARVNFRKVLGEMDAFFQSCPVLFRMDGFYIVAGVLPFVVALICVILYFTSDKEPGHSGPPTLADLVADPPQNRIFGVGMAIEALLILFFGLIRDHIVIFQAQRNIQLDRPIPLVLLRLSRFCIIISCFSLVALACVPVDSNITLHMVGAGFFFGAMLGYFLICDILTWRMQQPIKIISVGMTAAGFLTMILYVIMRTAASNDSAALYAAASVFSILGVVALLAKLLILLFEMPKHGIRLTRKLMYASDDKTD